MPGHEASPVGDDETLEALEVVKNWIIKGGDRPEDFIAILNDALKKDVIVELARAVDLAEDREESANRFLHIARHLAGFESEETSNG